LKVNRTTGARGSRQWQTTQAVRTTLFSSGGTGTGKTHLLHAVRNGIMARKPNAKVVYALRALCSGHGKSPAEQRDRRVQRYYRSVDALLIDDIQFFARQRTISRKNSSTPLTPA
jgi:chromosomal replication initiator protein